MSTDASFVSILFFFGLFLGLLFVFLGYLTYYLGKKKKINGVVGVRIPPTYRNPEVWMRTNIRGGLMLLLHGIFMIIFGMIFPSVHFPLFMLTFLLPLAIYLPYVVWYAYHLENQLKRTSQNA
jgi:uncharacterized membrane protein